MATSSMKRCSTLHHHYCLLPLLLLLALLFPCSTTSSSPPKISYVDHCESTVPHSTPAGGAVDYYSYISLSNGFLSGGDELLAPENPSTPSSIPGYFYFYSQNIRPTRTPGVFKLDGSLSLQGPSHTSLYTNSSRRGRRARRNRTTVLYNYRKTVSFTMTGFWSKPSGKICMVGSGYVTNESTTQTPAAVFKLNYPQTSDISTSLANGSIESLDKSTSPAHFEPISLLVYAQKNYNYTKIPQARRACSRRVGDVPKEVVGFGDDGPGSSSSSITTTCIHLQNMLNVWFQLEYDEDTCSVLDCGLLGFTPRFMSWNTVECSGEGKVHMYVAFSNDTNYEKRAVMEPEKSLVAEGVWDPEKNRLCVLAFPITVRKDSAVDASVGEAATIGISLWFPGVLSIESRSTTVGQIWSEKAAGGPLRDPKPVSFRNFDNNYGYLPGVRYEYTRTRDVNKSCGSGSRVGSLEDGRYPDGTSVGDLRFDISVSNSKGYGGWGSATPLSLGENFYGYSSGSFNPVLVQESATFEEANLWNVSYKLSYRSFNSSSATATEEVVDITAEGLYDTATGIICMVGCRDRNNSNGYSVDCEILISLQLAPMNAGVDGNVSSYSTMHLNGTIRSTRKKDDPLHFEPLALSSNNMYAAEATASVRRMDVEIIMVLVSKTLSCIFIGLQLLHVRKHPEVLPSMSIAMLVVLTLGHVTPLVLNFEALFFTDRNKQNVLLWSGGWLEANEVVVRLMTMLAFLLQMRLLQSAWNARSSDGDNGKSLGAAERKALRFCLPLYFAGALAAWFFHTRSYQNRSDFRDYSAQPSRSVWEDLIAYAGLLLDGFLLPQIVLNMIGNCTEKALSPPYYIGITAVRAFPHVYDAYRSRYYMPSLDSSIIFATSHEDLYSYAWDIIILLGGVLFAVIVFFQQRFGGSCFLPKRFRGAGGYELVSVATT
ncbi:uncharacterized protein M6B38_286280 [Iris pallida]|uniref:RING-type E3 ubiquitin transferase n=2 Tax=Iris pallida TaxID=29817 RepID=A0AAX6HY11_IRIPA|nr:uncharacterized protein M6B38_286280 [Iris pallida]